MNWDTTGLDEASKKHGWERKFYRRTEVRTCVISVGANGMLAVSCTDIPNQSFFHVYQESNGGSYSGPVNLLREIVEAPGDLPVEILEELKTVLKNVDDKKMQ